VPCRSPRAAIGAAPPVIATRHCAVPVSKLYEHTSVVITTNLDFEPPRGFAEAQHSERIEP
jgi:hypothetical protein